MKKLAIGVVAVLVLCVILALVAPFMIDLDKYKPTILAQIKPFVPREVDFEHIELSILSGLGADVVGLRVGGNPAFSQEDFLRLQSLQVRVRLLPLLRKQIRVKKVILQRPFVRVARNEEGRFSFDDFLQGGEATEEEPAAEPGVGLLAGLLVNSLEIRQGTIVYEDRAMFPTGEPIRVEGLDVRVRDLSVDRPVSLEVEAAVLGGDRPNVRMAGTVGPVGEDLRIENVPVKVQLSLLGVALEAVGPYLPQGLPLEATAGKLSGEVEAEGVLSGAVRSKARIVLEELMLRSPGDEGVAWPPANLELAYQGTAEVQAEKVTIASAAFSFNGSGVRLEGRVEGFRSTPSWDVTVRTEGLQPGTLVASIPLLAAQLPQGLDLEGVAELQLASSGSLEDFGADLQCDLGGLRIQYEDLFHKPQGTACSLKASGRREGERIVLRELKATLHQLALSGSGEVVTQDKQAQYGFLLQTTPVPLGGWDALVPSLKPYRPEGSLLVRSSLRGTNGDASVNLQASSERLAFRMPPSEGDRKGGEGSPGVLKGLNVEIQGKRRNDRLLASGKIQVEEGEALSVSFSRFLSNLRYADDRLGITGLDVRAFGGSLHGTGSYDLKKAAWAFAPEIKDVQVEDVLDALTPYGRLFSGTFDGRFKASGVTGAGASEALRASGTFRLARGELKNFDLVGSSLQALFGLKGVGRALYGAQGEIEQHAETRFDWLDGAFDLRGQKLTIEKAHLRNVWTSKITDSDANLTGTATLDAQALDLKGNVILSRKHSAELASQADVLHALLNEEQRMVLPLTLKGTFQKPVPFLDTEYVLGAISRYYARQGVEKLREGLGLPPTDQGGGEKPVERLLKDLFRKNVQPRDGKR